MKILSNYIFKELLTYFTICIVVFTSLILTTRILKFANLIVNKGVEVGQVAKVFLAIVPTFLEIALPMSVLLGVMLAFARLSGDSEIIVIRSSGIKIAQLLKPVVIFGLMITTFAFYLSFELRPLGYRVLNQTLYEIARNKSIAGITPGFFNKMGALTIYAEGIDYETGIMQKVLIDDRRNLEQRKTIFAERGKLVPKPASRQIALELYQGSLHEKPEGNYEVTKFSTNQMYLSTADIYGDASLRKDKRGRELKAVDILNEVEDLEYQIKSIVDVKDLEEMERRLNRIRIEFALRFATPWACLLMALIAVPLGIMPPRTQKTWGASFSLGVGVLFFIVYFGVLTLGITLGENGHLPPAIAVALPNLVLLFFCWHTLRRVNSEQWQSITDGLESLYLPIVSKFKKS